MYCRECGKKIEDGSRFCPECGGEIILNQTVQEDSTVFNTDKHNKKKRLIILGGVSVAVLIILIFFLFLKKKKMPIEGEWTNYGGIEWVFKDDGTCIALLPEEDIRVKGTWRYAMQENLRDGVCYFYDLELKNAETRGQWYAYVFYENGDERMAMNYEGGEKSIEDIFEVVNNSIGNEARDKLFDYTRMN